MSMTAAEKEKLELANLRKRVVTQREEIKRLNAIIETLKEQQDEASR